MSRSMQILFGLQHFSMMLQCEPPRKLVWRLLHVTGLDCWDMWEMSKGYGVGVDIFADQLPVVDGVKALLASGIKPGATGRNLSYLATSDIDSNVTEVQQLLAADPRHQVDCYFQWIWKSGRCLQVTRRRGVAVIVGRFRSSDSVKFDWYYRNKQVIVPRL